MNIFVYGKARKVSAPELERNLMFARVVGLVNLDCSCKNCFGLEGVKAVVRGDGDELWVIDRIDDSIILDEEGLPIRRGAELWELCCDEKEKYGIISLEYEDLFI